MHRMRLSRGVVILCVIVSTVSVLADGMVIPQVFYPKVEIPNQQALICFSNGILQLVIETSFQGEGTNFAWVVPLPSAPQVKPVSESFFTGLQQSLCIRVFGRSPPMLGLLLLIRGIPGNGRGLPRNGHLPPAPQPSCPAPYSILRVLGSAPEKPAEVLGQERLKTRNDCLLTLRPPFDRVAPCFSKLENKFSITRAALSTSGRGKSKVLSVILPAMKHSLRLRPCLRKGAVSIGSRL